MVEMLDACAPGSDQHTLLSAKLAQQVHVPLCMCVTVPLCMFVTVSLSGAPVVGLLDA